MKTLRTRAHRRHQRRRVIQRKLRIATFRWGLDEESIVIPGRFAKGKVHCSCGLCTMDNDVPTAQERRARAKEAHELHVLRYL